MKARVLAENDEQARSVASGIQIVVDMRTKHAPTITHDASLQIVAAIILLPIRVIRSISGCSPYAKHVL